MLSIMVGYIPMNPIPLIPEKKTHGRWSHGQVISSFRPLQKNGFQGGV